MTLIKYQFELRCLRFFCSGTTVFCTSDSCDPRKQQECVQIVRRYNDSPASAEPEGASEPSKNDDEYQTLRHVVLLLVLSCSMFVVRYFPIFKKNNNPLVIIHLSFGFICRA